MIQALKLMIRGLKAMTRISSLLRGAVVAVAILLPADATWAQPPQAAVKSVRLVSIRPTPLFAVGAKELQQRVDAVFENLGQPVQANLDVRIGSFAHSVPVGTVKEGKSTFHFFLPEIRQPRPAQFVLKVGGAAVDARQIDWQPRKHWTIYLVPITHHDLGYTDTIENVMKRYEGFYDDIVRFCDQTNDWPEEAKYRYTVEGTWSLQHYVATRPKEAVDKLSEYVKQGRIEIGALFGNEIDSLCGHEELIRLMYPSFRLKRHYGGQINVGSITDVPGLAWALPSMLAGAGVRYFFAGLPTYFEEGRNDIHTFWDEAAVMRHGRPDAFRWQGPDGQTVLVYYQGSYGFFDRPVVEAARFRTLGPDSYEEVMKVLPGMLDEMERNGSPFDVARYIHNGVDNFPPDLKISSVVRHWNEKWAYPKLVVATNSMFFQALEKQCTDVRTFRGELPHTDYVVGAISTAKETAVNRLTHDRLLSAEKAATVASLVSGYTYPAGRISQAYDNALLYDEHTWGKAYPAGESQDLAWNEKSLFAYKAAGLAEDVLSESIERLASKVQLEQPQRHLVVFNLLGFDRTDVVRVTRFRQDEPFDLIDNETGRKVAYQLVELDGPLAPTPYAPQRWARGQFEKHELFDLVFAAANVPSMGYKTYRLAPRDAKAADGSGIHAGQNTLENSFFKVTLDPRTGAIASIYDKELSRELVDPRAPDKLNQFVAKWVQTGKREGPSAVSIRAGQNGPVYASLISQSSGPGCPQIIQEVTLYEGIKRIDFSNRLLKGSTPLLEIYFAFPFKVDEPKFRFEGVNSVIEPLKDQFPGSNTNYYAVQHWATVSNQGVGITLSSVESHLLEFGGLWPCYVSQAHHGVTPPGFGEPFVKSDQLRNGYIYAFVLDNNFRTNFQPVQQADILFRYSLTSGEGQRANSANRNFGWAIHNPLIGVVEKGGRTGPLGDRTSFCRLDLSNVMLLTLKQAEDGHGVVVRLIETDGKQGTVTLTMPTVAIEKAWQTNLVEEDQAGLESTDHSVTVPVRPFGISTVRLQLR